MKPDKVSRLWWGVSALSLAGLGLATYLTVVYISGHGPACGPGGGCGAVTTSTYAVFAGIPVAMIGVGGYSLMLLGSLAVLGMGHPPAVLRRGLLVIAATGVGFSAYLTATQAFFLRAFCAYCLSSAAVMTLVLLLTLSAVLMERANRQDSGSPLSKES